MKTFLALPLPLILLLAGPTVAQLEPVALTQPALPVSAGLLWVKVRKPITIEELASSLRQDESGLAKLNGVDEDHQLKSGDWLVLPSQSSRLVKQLAAVDTSELRRTPPQAAAPEAGEPARVRFGDTLLKIAQRYNLTITELLRLNPTLQAARLVVGTQIDVAQSAPGRNRMVLGLAPTGSGGLGLPDQPESAPNRTESDQFVKSLNALVGSGVISSFERNAILRPLSPYPFALREPCRSGALTSTECRGLLRGRTPVTGLRWPSNPLGLDTPAPLTLRSAREQTLLDRIRHDNRSPQWRTYGQCRYDWRGWRLHPNGTRTTAADCGGTSMRWQIGVSCTRLLVATHTTASGWSQWKSPAGSESKERQGEDEMVAALCANTLTTSVADPTASHP